jgi:superfamily II DNA or RNA helicase
LSSQLVDSSSAFETSRPSWSFESLVVADAAGEAAPEGRAILEASPDLWRVTLEDLIDETEESLVSVRRLTGDERAQVVADFEAERDRLEIALARLTGVPLPGDAAADATPGQVQLQATWSDGELIAWAGGPGCTPLGADEVRSWLAESRATSTWATHQGVPLPGGGRAPAVSASMREVIGWLVSLATQTDLEPASAPTIDPEAVTEHDGVTVEPVHPDEVASPPRIAPSLRWLATVAAWAVELVAHGRMVPQLAAQPGGRTPGEKSGYAVEWTPALLDPKRLATTAELLPGSVMALDASRPAHEVTHDVLTAMVDTICRLGIERLEVPASPDRPNSAHETAEAFLSRLDGTRFYPSKRAAAELAGRLERWARPLAKPGAVRLIVQLDPPDEGNAWHLSVLADGVDRHPTLLDQALVTAPVAKRRQVETELQRLERLLPVLGRPGGHRRGEVVLSQDEAWELMADTGRQLSAAGFDVRVPVLARRRPSPKLRLEADQAAPSVVGANQLADVRWSVLFDDVELDAADIRRLAAEARPLVRSRGQWIALDHADLAAAAAALDERGAKSQLTGAELLRHALGLQGTPLAGGLSIVGSNWAADLMRRAEEIRSEPMGAPAGFAGELRSYQAEALAWLGFLEGAGLGGCLALDMGLGKTPTLLAHLLAFRGNGPSLVVAPPAVVGNWAAEAKRFTSELRVVVHHGAGRKAAAALAREVAGADVVLTTYGTAVRDIDALADVDWHHVVLDEAQTIKNPASDTAQQLRRLQAHSRIALTGTPIENGLGDLWSILDFTNPGLVGPRPQFIAQLSHDRSADTAATASGRDAGESALRALNGLLVFRRTKAEPAIAAELPERIDQLDHCSMTPAQIGLYQAVLDQLVVDASSSEGPAKKGAVLAAITALKQICNHPAAYQDDDEPLSGRSGKLNRLDEIVDAVFAADERVLVFTHFAKWGVKLAQHLSDRTGTTVECYHGGLSRGARDKIIADFQAGTGAGALVLSLKAGGTGLNLTSANHVVLYDRWWNPAVEDQARDRVWRIGQTHTVVAHRLVCPGTVDERVEEVVAGKRQIADLVLPKSSSISDLDASQLRQALGLATEELIIDESDPATDLEDDA